jgi:hypothetical protein
MHGQGILFECKLCYSLIIFVMQTQQRKPRILAYIKDRMSAVVQVAGWLESVQVEQYTQDMLQKRGIGYIADFDNILDTLDTERALSDVDRVYWLQVCI